MSRPTTPPTRSTSTTVPCSTRENGHLPRQRRDALLHRERRRPQVSVLHRRNALHQCTRQPCTMSPSDLWRPASNCGFSTTIGERRHLSSSAFSKRIGSRFRMTFSRHRERVADRGLARSSTRVASSFRSARSVSTTLLFTLSPAPTVRECLVLRYRGSVDQIVEGVRLCNKGSCVGQCISSTGELQFLAPLQPSANLSVPMFWGPRSSGGMSPWECCLRCPR
jgi:hypothetical protein